MQGDQQPRLLERLEHVFGSSTQAMLPLGHVLPCVGAARLFDFTVSDQGLQVIDTNRLISTLVNGFQSGRHSSVLNAFMRQRIIMWSDSQKIHSPSSLQKECLQ